MSSGTVDRSDARVGLRASGAIFLLIVALAFPVALMFLNPTLMFDRGWHQYAGTAIYSWAVVMLISAWHRQRRDEAAFRNATELLDQVLRGDRVRPEDNRVLPSRLRQLDGHTQGESRPGIGPLMELNRELSGLDQERTAGRFTLTKYILYLLPVIGFIGTVEGISHALMNISIALPMVKDLDGFLSNLTGVTHALQIAFDSTLLALFLSGALMFAQTVVYRMAEDHLARVDAWVVEHVLPALGDPESPAEALGSQLDRLRDDLVATLQAQLGAGFGPSVNRFAEAVDRLPNSIDDLRRGTETMARIADDLGAVGESNELLRRLVTTTARIEAGLEAGADLSPQLDPIRRGLERTTVAVESLSEQWTSAFERSNRASQEQLTRTLSSLKDALDLLHVSMEQSNALYRNIVRKMFKDTALGGKTSDDLSDAA